MRRVRALLAVVAIALLAAIAWLALPRSAEPPPRDERLVDVSDPGPAERPPVPQGAPNLVLVVGCTVRKDQTSLHGGPPATTPFLASLATEGVTLDDLVSAAPWTRAASTALLTGHHPV